MFQAIHDGSIKFLWVMATNPAVSMPDAGFVREALAKCPTVVVSDCIADSDTAGFAHIRLPALGWSEKDGTVTNSERTVSRQRALFAAPGEARADWQIICDVAEAMGHGESFDFASPADIFREYAAMTRLARRHGKLLDLADKAGIRDADYAAMAPFQWGGKQPFEQRFPTADGRARLIAVEAPGACGHLSGDPTFPLRLNTGRYRDQWHTMTRTGLSPTLSQHRREALLEIHPADADARGLSDGRLARVITRHGVANFRVSISSGQRRGDIFVPMHWTDAMAGAARANRLVGQGADPLSGQPGFKNTPARVEAVVPEWRAFLVTRSRPEPGDLLWWSRSKVAGGWLYELAGDGSIAVDELLPAGARLEVADHAGGMRRIAVRDEDGSLAAVLYVTRSGQLPAREWAAAQLGTSDGVAAELLAGRPGTPGPDRGPIVCVCHGVGAAVILAAAGAGAACVRTIGEATRAGTNCGSCRPAIGRLLKAPLEPRIAHQPA
jgi:assimilatory nitrate reductase catalytic subunit